jgi:dTDP-4-amino-4,6-dideoxygalactose transaminase
MNVPFVDLSRQFKPILDDIFKSMMNVIERCAFIKGSEVGLFEKKMAEWLGIKEVCGVSNGTHALALTLKALGIGRGDEVIVPPNTAFPTAEAVNLSGAEVVFADISRDYYNLDPIDTERRITGKTKAIIPVHLYGIPADMDSFLNISKKYNVFIIEDVAQAMGAKYKGRMVGSIAHAGCFSFFPSKNLGTFGDGGAVASNNIELIKNVRMLADHGRNNKFTHFFIGTNSRLDTLKAAQLLICLDYLNEWNKRRQEAALLYNELLKPYEEIVTPKVPEECEAVWHLYVIRYSDREGLKEYLNKNGIKTGLHYPLPLHLQPAYEYLGLKKGSFPNAEVACSEVLSLPMFPFITTDEIEFVVKHIIKYLENKKRYY